MPKSGTLERDISPPPLRKTLTPFIRTALAKKNAAKPTSAAIEAGKVEIRDHLNYFVVHLSALCKPSGGPRIAILDFENLYRCNQHAQGRHFVVHQHDHPISGVHYDLRLQFSATSSISFAVPYGMPGNPNSMRPNRLAIETRVHNVWNHLIESASHATGSLLIWDTGEYEILPRKRRYRKQATDDEGSDVESNSYESMTENEKLAQAFQSRHIRLRLHGRRLPPNYTVALRLPFHNDQSTLVNGRPVKRRRLGPVKTAKPSPGESDTDADVGSSEQGDQSMEGELAAGNASDDEGEDAIIRANNAYTGATNTIGSIHQRHWFLTLDRYNSGFRRARNGNNTGRWCGPWEAFYVRGRDHEESVVTGRLADDVMADEGVAKFAGRKMWRPIME